MTKATYRKKALPYLLKDFAGHCAYCLDPSELRHPNQTHIDHFDCKLKERRRHQYKNLMLACSACNLSKHDKPVVNKYDPAQRLLNCTLENEFPAHITENANGEWVPQTPAATYHIRSIGLDESCHNKKRRMRKNLASSILSLCTTAIQYTSQNPVETHETIMAEAKKILCELDNLPPLVTEKGLMTARDWLAANGVTFQHH